MNLTIDPLRYIEIKGEVSQLESVFTVQVAATDVIFVPAVTGKRIRGQGFVLTANAAGTNPAISFKNGSGGSVLYAVTIPALTVGEHARPFSEPGYFETSTGVGLYLDIGTATANVFLNYIVYTPQ